jgi:hypothetical protein
VRNALVVFTILLVVPPTFAYGPFIIIHGVIAPDEGGNSYSPATVIHGVAGGTAAIFDHPDYGRMLVVEGADFGASDEETNHNGPMVIIHGVAYGPMVVFDGLAYGPAIISHGATTTPEGGTNNYGPAIVIHG